MITRDELIRMAEVAQDCSYECWDNAESSEDNKETLDNDHNFVAELSKRLQSGEAIA